MYLEHFGLQTDPFKLDPNLDFVFVSTGHKEAIAHLVYGIEQGESFVLITGGIGTGKTLALHFLLDQIVSNFKTSFINVTQIDFLELLKMILDDLDVPFDRNGDKADLLQIFKSFLLETRKNRGRVLLVVDEAQELSMKTLEALRLLSNLTQPGEQNLQIVIAGQPGLEKMIDSPELEQLQQRIRVRYDLETLSADEIEPYVEHRLAVAGRKDPLFTKGALKKLFKLSHGVPRLVNSQADQALLAAFVDGSSKVNESHFEDNHEFAEPVATSDIAPAPVVPRSAPSTNPSPVVKEPKRRMAALWLIFPVLLVFGAWYTYSQTSLLDSMFDRGSVSPQQQNQTNLVPNHHEEQPAQVTLQQTPSTPEANKPQVNEPSNPPQETHVEEAEVAIAQPAITPAPKNQFSLHVASFRTMIHAQSQLSEFEREGLEAYIEETSVEGKNWFRIYIGPFGSRDLAKAKGQKLKNEGLIGYYRVSGRTS